MNNKPEFVRDLPKEGLIFSSDSQDVAAMNAEFEADFDSYFVIIGEGEYIRAWGMYGIVPWLTRQVYEVTL